MSQGSLFTGDEKLVCTQIALGEPPYSQRAQALLALDAGATLDFAAAQSGLTPNQVKYWNGRFRTRRLDIFPDYVLEAAAPVEIEVVTLVSVLETAVATDKPKNKKAKKQAGKKNKKSKKKEKPMAKDKKKKKGKKGGKKKKADAKKDKKSKKKKKK